MEIRFEFDSISKIVEEAAAIDGVVVAPAFKNVFNSLQELQEYNKSVRRYREYCEKNNIPMVRICPWP